MVPCYLLFQIRKERGTWHITSGVIMDMSIVLLKPQEKPANKKSSPKWDLLQGNLAEGGEKEVQHK